MEGQRESIPSARCTGRCVRRRDFLHTSFGEMRIINHARARDCAGRGRAGTGGAFCCGSQELWPGGGIRNSPPLRQQRASSLSMIKWATRYPHINIGHNNITGLYDDVRILKFRFFFSPRAVRTRKKKGDVVSTAPI